VILPRHFLTLCNFEHPQLNSSPSERTIETI
jgi:hypothetical protein